MIVGDSAETERATNTERSMRTIARNSRRMRSRALFKRNPVVAVPAKDWAAAIQSRRMNLIEKMSQPEITRPLALSSVPIILPVRVEMNMNSVRLPLRALAPRRHALCHSTRMETNHADALRARAASDCGSTTDDGRREVPAPHGEHWHDLHSFLGDLVGECRRSALISHSISRVTSRPAERSGQIHRRIRDLGRQLP